MALSENISSLIDYLGMGDSYTSGEGAFNYRAGTDTENNHCHLSARSYPMLLTKDLFSSRGGHSIACSGAIIHDVATKAKDYRGQLDNGQTFEKLQEDNRDLFDSVMANFMPGYIAQHRFAAHYQPAVTTLSIGGNDIGFGDILQQCVIPHVSRHQSDNVCFNTYEDRQEVVNLIDRTVPRWTRLFNQIKAEAPLTRLYAIGYPSIISDQGRCGRNVHLGKSELEFAEELVIYLNAAIKKAAERSGAVYVDISKALVGFRLCEGEGSGIAVNGLTAGNDAGIFGLKVLGLESYHPNALGHELIEQEILRQTDNLTSLPATKEDPPRNSKLLNAPRSGRKLSSRAPAPKSAPKVVKKKSTGRAKTKASSTGIKPKTPVQVRLDGLNGPVIGSGESDEAGDTDIPITMPEDTVPGGHTIDTTGENQTGEPVDASQPVYVPEDDNDADGDGLPNTNDSCPAAVNSSFDEDGDGTDDACDGYIGPPGEPLLPVKLGTGISINNLGGGVPLKPGGPKIVATLNIGPAPIKRKLARTGHLAGTITKNRHAFKWPLWLVRLCLLWLLLLLILLLIEHYIERRDNHAYA